MLFKIMVYLGVYVFVCSYLITMRCPKTGFTPLKIASLVVGGIAIIVHITAVAYPEWDGIDAQWHPSEHAPFTLPVKAYGSLWKFTLVKDSTRKMFLLPSAQHLTDTAWKYPIILMATTGIAVGIVGEGLIVLTALLERCTKNFYIHLCAKMISVTSVLCASFECLMGAILYMYNFTKQQAPKDLNFTKGVPYNEHVPQAGVYLECAAGGLFILTSLLTILDIMYYEKKEAVSINPAMNEEKPKNVGKDKTINENKKKGEKLVLEDVTEEKSEKKK